MAQIERPLSPHIGIYRWQVSSTLSILHRFTGVILSIGAFVLVGWLVTVAAGYEAYARFIGGLSGVLGRTFLFIWSFSFFYHLCNGVRHLFWDAGIGFDKARARQTGWGVVAAAAIMTLLLWLFGAGG